MSKRKDRNKEFRQSFPSLFRVIMETVKEVTIPLKNKR